MEKMDVRYSRNLEQAFCIIPCEGEEGERGMLQRTPPSSRPLDGLSLPYRLPSHFPSPIPLSADKMKFRLRPSWRAEQRRGERTGKVAADVL